VALKNVGVDLVLSGFLHFIEEVEYFGEKFYRWSVNLNNNRNIQSRSKISLVFSIKKKNKRNGKYSPRLGLGLFLF
jgi:hypothetical protein